MTKPNTPITKICSSCGEQKPLSAFLELTGTQGARYGSICAICRKTQIDNADTPKDIEDSTRSTTGVKMDAKAKVKGEADKRALFKQTEDQYFENRDDSELLKDKRVETIKTIAHDQKMHRQTYIEKKSFLDSSKKPSTTSQHQVFGGEHQKAKENQINLSAPMLDTGIAGKEKYKSSVFNQFTAFLGGSAPIVNALNQAKKRQGQPSKPEAKDELTEYIQKNRGPGAKK